MAPGEARDVKIADVGISSNFEINCPIYHPISS